MYAPDLERVVDERRIVLERLALSRRVRPLAARCLPSPKLDVAVVTARKRPWLCCRRRIEWSYDVLASSSPVVSDRLHVVAQRIQPMLQVALCRKFRCCCRCSPR